MKKTEDHYKQTNKVNLLTEHKCKWAVRLLEERVSFICNVQQWANEVGVSREWLYKAIKVIYGKPPKIMIREMKYKKVVQLIQKQGFEARCYAVAIDAGFKNETSLSKFLSSFYDTNFTDLKIEINIEKDIEPNI